MYTHVFVSWGKGCWFFGKFNVHMDDPLELRDGEGDKD